MATYANNSNPFIKTENTCTTNGNGGKEPNVNKSELAPKRKVAPGMAMPQSCILDLKKMDKEVSNSKDVNDNRIIDCNGSSISFSSNANNNTEIELLSRKAEKDEEDKSSNIGIIVGLDSTIDLEKSESPLITKYEDNESSAVINEFDEITKACESLVETTIRYELEEAAAAANSSKNRSCMDNNDDEDENNNSSIYKSESDTKTLSGEQRLKRSDENDLNLKQVEVEADVNVDVDADPDPDAGGDSGEDREEQQQQQQRKGGGHHQHMELIKKLRLQLRDLERYAYERGELGQVPASVIAERQTVILDTLKERLSLSIDIEELEKLELDELKKQVDKEIHDLIDPLMTKDHLVGQLRTQLTDLERYINYLHGTIGKIHDKSTCSCHIHGCCTKKLAELSLSLNDEESSSSSTTIDGLRTTKEQFDRNTTNESRLMTSSNNTDTLPKTTKLIRSLVTQLICSDIKLRESAKKAQILEEKSNHNENDGDGDDDDDGYHNNNSNNNKSKQIQGRKGSSTSAVGLSRPLKNQDDAAWTLHIDKVILATDSLVNLFTSEVKYQSIATDNSIDGRLVESIVRRQLVPAIRDLLGYGLIDLSSMPKSTSYVSLLFDPYYLLTSLTCFPSLNKATDTNSSGGYNNGSSTSSTTMKNGGDKIHLWNVIEEYYKTRNDSNFNRSSVKTLSQSFDLAPSISGPIKVTSKQALLIAIDDISETLSRSKPNGPESHFRAFIYAALIRAKLSTWLRIIFKNKSIIKRFYHNFSFVGQSEKMDKFLATIEPLNQFSFKLRTDVESIEQFVSAF